MELRLINKVFFCLFRFIDFISFFFHNFLSSSLLSSLPPLLDVHGNTPLHVAAEERRTNSIEILLKLGANVHVRNRDGETPLFVGVEAASSNAFYWHPNDLEALIAAGSDLRYCFVLFYFILFLLNFCDALIYPFIIITEEL